ncbi:hypothetical protein GCM10010505_31070 [Kitasatospora aburaviensis]
MSPPSPSAVLVLAEGDGLAGLGTLYNANIGDQARCCPHPGRAISLRGRAGPARAAARTDPGTAQLFAVVTELKVTLAIGWPSVPPSRVPAAAIF